MKLNYCTRCVYPAGAVNVLLDDDGICSACRMSEEILNCSQEFWKIRRNKFLEITETYRSKDRGHYDCIIPVSGGKDSYWQTHLIKNEFQLNPLLVTYHGNNYLPEGQGNLERMRDIFGVDHLIFGPSVETLKKLNLACFRKMGDMNWHAHAGIKIFPIIAAVRHKVPLVVWGEITWMVSGMFSPDDYVEYNKRTVLEHDLRGYRPEDMVGAETGLSNSDLLWLNFPSDQEMEEVGMKGIYIGNFFNWDPNVHALDMQKKFGFEFARRPFERTYRTMSNLDDMHENGLHDYMKFVKFGYGRASDHACKDIRSGYMTRDEGIAMIRRYDHVKPTLDLKRWLEYVGIALEEFDVIADGFRNPRIWWIENGKWVKENIWGIPSSYGPVHLKDPELIKSFIR